MVIAVNAQNFMKGYYVNTKHDTVRGFVDYRSDSRNFRACIFKSSIETFPETFYPDDILGFGLDESVAYEDHTYKQKGSKDLVGFFKVLVRGELTLLSYDRRYFALTDKGEMLEVTKSRADASGVKDNFIGLGNLKVLMSDCPTTTQAWLSQQYSDQNLKTIFVTYNQCVNSPVKIFDEARTTLKVNTGVQVVPSVIFMSSGYPMDATDMTYNKTVVGGAFLSFNNPRTWGRTNVILEANYYQYNGYGFFRKEDAVADMNNDVFAKYKALQLPLYVRFGKKYFFDIGMLNHVILSQDIKWRVEYIPPATPNTVITTTDFSADKLRFWSIGVVAGVGTRFNIRSYPVRAFARYSRSGNSFFSSEPGYQAISVGLSFQLTKN